MNYPIYMDYSATTPCYSEVVEAMIPYFTKDFGNAASKNHPYGWVADDAVEAARIQIANLLGAKSKEIIFTSGATEAINLGIRGIFDRYKGERQHYITCKTEHKAVLDTFRFLEEQGAEVTYLTVDNLGNIDLSDLKTKIQPHTKMVCLMWANNETGVIHPMQEIKAICKAHDIILMSDAVQATGKIKIDTTDIHLMALSAHKLYGPKGIGALYIRHNHPLPKPVEQITGGGHEKGFRSGTLNVPAAVGFGMAAKIRRELMEEEAERLKRLTVLLEKSILKIPDTYLNGGGERLPHIINISFEGVEGEDLLRTISKEVAVSSGSACSSITPKPSHVLLAMGVAPDLARASIRFSLGNYTSESDIIKVAGVVELAIEKLRS